MYIVFVYIQNVYAATAAHYVICISLSSQYVRKQELLTQGLTSGCVIVFSTQNTKVGSAKKRNLMHLIIDNTVLAIESESIYLCVVRLHHIVN